MSQFYKNKTATEVRVGILTLIGLAILFAGYAWFREAFESRHLQTVRVHFDYAAHLEPGDGVSVNGVKCGKVKALEVAETGVTAELSVRLDFPLREGTQFIIQETNLMGDRGVEILPGTGTQTLDLAQVQRGENRTDLNEFVARLGGVVTRVDSLLATLNGPGNLISSLNEIADTSKVLLRSTNRFVNRTDDRLAIVLTGISRNSQELSDIMAENRGSVTNSFQSLDQILTDLRTDFVRLDRIVQRTDTLSAQFSRKDSNMSLLLKDRALYDQLLKSSGQLDSLLNDVRKNPKRYFKFSVF